MNRNCRVVSLVVSVLLAACQPPPSAPSPRSPSAQATPAPAGEGAVTDWEALMPEGATVLRPPPSIGGRGLGPPTPPGGLIDDNGSGTMPGVVIDHSSPDRAQQFGSSEVVQAVEGREVSLDGYVVPLESDDQGQVSELLFVSFYGACIHVPPPPPNQIIRVVLARPIAVPVPWDAFHLSGTLHISRFDGDIASASYEVPGGRMRKISG